MAVEKETYLEEAATFQSFAGADLKAIATFKGADGRPQQRVIGSLNSATVSVVREVSPIYPMGRQTFASVSRGKRAISGTLSFVVFDRDPLVRDLVSINELSKLSSQWSAILKNLQTGVGVNEGVVQSTTDFSTAAKRAAGALAAIQNLYGLMKNTKLNYADQLAPFDVTFSFINDQGAASKAAIRQIYIVSQGAGWSMADMGSEQVYSYIARFYEPLQPLVGVNDRISYDAFNEVDREIMGGMNVPLI